MEIMMMVVMEILLALLPQWQSCVRVQRHQWRRPLRQQRPHPERCWWRIRCCSCGSERLVPGLPGDSGQTEIGVRVRSAKCCRYVRLKFGDSPQSSAANLWNRKWFSGNCLLTSVQGGMKKILTFQISQPFKSTTSSPWTHPAWARATPTPGTKASLQR